MKNLFPQYADASELAYGKVWKNALFVFDTNVLLNLYRYQSSTRDELLQVLNKLSGRIWIPHHVGLEFQRNRLKVIAEQNKRFIDVRRTIEKAKVGLFSELDKLQLQTRHSLINPQPLTSGFEKLVDSFLAELEMLHGKQQKLNASDPLKEKIEDIFNGRIGDPPKDQEEIDKLYKNAEERFKLKIPPGYQDADKDSDDASGYIHGGIIYKRKFGDYLVWQQIVAHAKSTQAKSVIFVTDDGKNDWWNKIEFDGLKTIGPRPELIEEVRLLASVENFLMYNPESFLKYSKDFLKAQISEKTLEEVRDVSITSSSWAESRLNFQQNFLRAERAIIHWLEGTFDIVFLNEFPSPPDLMAVVDNKMYGFTIKFVTITRWGKKRMGEFISRTFAECREKGIAEIGIIWLVNNSSDSAALKQIILSSFHNELPTNIRMIIGMLDGAESDELAFTPIENFAFHEFKQSHENLTSREYEVMRMLGSGKNTSEIAEALSLSVRTVSVYLARILEKLKLKNNAELTHYVIKNGLSNLPPTQNKN